MSAARLVRLMHIPSTTSSSCSCGSPLKPLGDLPSTHLLLYKMLILLTELTINKQNLTFNPFALEIPDDEWHWDYGREHMEGLIAEKDCFPDEVIDQIPDDVEDFTFDYDFQYHVVC